MKVQGLKQQLYQCLTEIVEEKIGIATSNLEFIANSKKNETKSSAGDKHETGRAMMQREEEQGNAQLAKALELKNVLSQLDLDRTLSKVEFGSLVETNHGTYFLSIGLGQIEVGETNCFAISPVSPLGQLLLSKTVGDKAVFRDKEYAIKQII